MSNVLHANDLNLVRRVAGGDRASFDRLFGEIFPRLHRFVRSRVGMDADATQEVCQQVMTRAIERLASYRGEASLFTWFCQIARHELADRWERTARERTRFRSYDQDETIRAALESIESEQGLTPERLHHRGELLALVQAVLDHLPKHYADALEQKYIEGLDVHSIAERAGMTTAAIQAILARAREAFRVEFRALASEFVEDLKVSS